MQWYIILEMATQMGQWSLLTGNHTWAIFIHIYIYVYIYIHRMGPQSFLSWLKTKIAIVYGTYNYI